MRSFAVYKLILLALLLAVSHVALASHITTHSENEFGQCEFCFGQSDSKSAIVQTEVCTDPQAGSDGVFTAFLTCLVFHDVFKPYHSRAPPFLF
jgi:hypothetical protein